MSTLKQAQRFFYINYVLAKSGLDQLLFSLHYFSAFRFIVYLNPWNWFRSQPFQRGVALRETLVKLGPIFIKFGQALSTRPDIIPADIMVELSKLQDSVPPFSSEEVIRILEETYGQSPYTMFDGFDSVPLASASIAQVHSAYLKTGESIVIKVLRPHIREIIDRDLAILRRMAHMLDQRWWASKYLKPKDLVAEFERNLLEELDLQTEAANASQLRRNFQDSPLLYVPHIHWEYVRDNVLVMERIYGIPAADLDQLRSHGINLKKLAECGLQVFFTQVFRDCFFHADMHPGNIFVSPLHPENPQYICVDFGIIGTLNDRDKRYLAENLLAFFNQDYRRVAELHVESGWVARTTRVDDFESAVRTLCEPIFQRSLKDISFAMLVMQLFQVARRFKMEIQPQLILLQKTLFAVEGLGRQLYPELDLWATAKPFLEKWLRDQMGPKALFHHLRENIPFFVEQLPYMPRLMYDLMMITKNREISDVAPKSTVENRVISKHFWYNGLGVGIFLVMALWGGVSYFNWVDQGNLLMFAMGAALFGGVTALTHRTKRS